MSVGLTSAAPAADLFAAVGQSAAVAGQVSIPPADDSLVPQALRLVGLVVGAFVVSAVVSDRMGCEFRQIALFNHTKANGRQYGL